MSTIAIDPTSVATLTEVGLSIPVRDRLLNLFQPLVEAPTLRRFEKTLDSIVLEYIPFKFLTSNRISAEASRENKTAQDVVRDINEGLWNALGSSEGTPFSRKDRESLMDGLRWQANFVELAQQASEHGDGEAITSAFIEGFWALQKADVCLSAAVLLAQGLLTDANPKAARWLCSSVRKAYDQVDSHLFLNSPELARRLSSSGKTLTTAQLERRLGL